MRRRMFHRAAKRLLRRLGRPLPPVAGVTLSLDESIPVLVSTRWEAEWLVAAMEWSRLRAVCLSTDGWLLLAARGLDHRAVLHDPLFPGSGYVEAIDEVEALARELDSSTASHLQALTGAEVTTGWEYWDKLMFLHSMLVPLRWLPHAVLQSLPRRIAVLCYGSAQDYLSPSALRSQMLVRALQAAGREVVPVAVPQPPNHDAQLWHGHYRLPVDSPVPQGGQLVCLATAWYAAPALRQRYAGEAVVDIQSPWYDVPIHDRRLTLHTAASPQLPVADLAPIVAGHQSLLQRLGVDGLPGAAAQLQRWQHRLQFQRRALDVLRGLRRDHGLQLGAMSDHDGGLFGPLVSAFAGQPARVRIHPHSTLCLGPMPALAADVEDVLDTTRSLRPFGDQPLPPPTLWPVLRQRAAPNRCVVLVFNEIDDTSGLPVMSLGWLQQVVTTLVPALRTRGLEPLLRPRGTSAVEGLFAALRVPSGTGPLDALVTAAGACIGVGQPTSAILRFWLAGVPTAHVQPRQPSLFEDYLLPRTGLPCLYADDAAAAARRVLGFIDGAFSGATAHIG